MSIQIDRIDDTTGGDPNSSSFQASISADGRYLAFSSFASDLVRTARPTHLRRRPRVG